MKIYKWVPISTSEQKKKGKDHIVKENGISRKTTADSSNSNFTLAEDSNTCKFENFTLTLRQSYFNERLFMRMNSLFFIENTQKAHAEIGK